MSAAAKRTASGARRWLVGLVAVGAVAIMLAVGMAAWSWTTQPLLPSVDLTGADPAVVEAVGAASAGVRAAPRSDIAWAKLGVVLYAHYYHPEAAACFAQAAHLNPSQVRWPALQAAAIRVADPERAIALYERAVALSGGVSDELEPDLAELYLQQGAFDGARRRFELVLARRPDDPRVHRGLARIAVAENDLAAGLAHLTFALDDAHTKKGAYRLLAETQERAGDHAAALQARARAEEAPDDLTWPTPLVDEEFLWPVGKQARLRRVKDLERQGRQDAARSLAANLEQQYPDVYWLVEGRVLAKQGQWEAASSALKKAVGFNPDSIDARLELGGALLKRKEYKEAAECFEQVIEREPTHGPAYKNLAWCKKMLADRTGAVDAYRQAVKYAPFIAETRRDLGELLLEDGRKQEALLELRQALQLQPDDEKTTELLRKASQ